PVRTDASRRFCLGPGPGDRGPARRGMTVACRPPISGAPAPCLSWEFCMPRRMFCALVAACAMHFATHAQTAPTSLNFGMISTESSNNLKTVWGPVIEDLSKALGMPVQPFFASDYAGIIEAMRFNKVHVGWFGNRSAIEAVD